MEGMDTDDERDGDELATLFPTRSDPPPVQVDDDDDVFVEETETVRDPPDPGTCPICLLAFTDKTLLDPCLHAYCFTCIGEWAAISRACPLCKRHFDAAAHDIRSDERFKRVTFPPLHRQVGSQMGVGRRERGNTNTYPRTTSSHTAIPRPVRRWGGAGNRDVMRVDEYEEAVLDRRRYIYTNNLRLRHAAPKTQHPTPTLFSRDPSLTARLLPFLRRDLPLLLDTTNPSTISLVSEYILGVAKKHDLRSDAAITALQQFFGSKSELFVNEALGFLKGDWDLRTFDRYAQYDADVPRVDVFVKRRRRGQGLAGDESRPRSREDTATARSGGSHRARATQSVSREGGSSLNMAEALKQRVRSRSRSQSPARSRASEKRRRRSTSCGSVDGACSDEIGTSRKPQRGSSTNHQHPSRRKRRSHERSPTHDLALSTSETWDTTPPRSPSVLSISSTESAPSVPVESDEAQVKVSVQQFPTRDDAQSQQHFSNSNNPPTGIDDTAWTTSRFSPILVEPASAAKVVNIVGAAARRDGFALECPKAPREFTIVGAARRSASHIV